MNKSIPIAIIAAIIFGAAGFYGGMLYGTSKSSSNSAAVAGNRPTGVQNGNASGVGGIVYGEIISVDSSSMTVKASDSGSKIVFFSGTSKISKNVDAQISDLAVGQTVMASGTANSDGSISSKTVEINPQTKINSQSGRSGSGGTAASATKTQDSQTESGSGDFGMPPMDDGGAGGPPPGM
ncbi:MAG: DUF5666 domain-containing protein [Candidatus Nealsonbacteria bacterium DGGOD1a]|nr:MAG: DUF5666 domain-containing protein [Candidatus Nealsonbacteria bacterium DGGOD1a]